MRAPIIISKSLSILLVVLFFFGCYRDVARIRVDESSRMLVESEQGETPGEELPRVERTVSGAQVARFEDDRCRLEVVSRVESVSKPKFSSGGVTRRTIETRTAKCPAVVSLDKDGALTVEEDAGRKHFYQSDNLVDIKIKHYSKNQGVMSTGIALAWLGGVGVTVSGSLGFMRMAGECGSCRVPALVGFSTGALFIVAGIGMWVNGKRKLSTSPGLSPNGIGIRLDY